MFGLSMDSVLKMVAFFPDFLRLNRCFQFSPDKGHFPTKDKKNVWFSEGSIEFSEHLQHFQGEGQQTEIQKEKTFLSLSSDIE